MLWNNEIEIEMVLCFYYRHDCKQFRLCLLKLFIAITEVWVRILIVFENGISLKGNSKVVIP